MGHAFECWNDSNYYQIDSQYPNLRLVQKGTIQTTVMPPDVRGSNNTRYAEITVNAANPVIAFRCTGHCSSVGVGFNGSSYTHRFYTEGSQFVDYWAFATEPAEIHAGLQVFNDQGVLVFTSRDQPAKLFGNWDAPNLNQNGRAQVNFAGVRQLAVIANSANYGMYSTFWGPTTKYADVWAYAVAINGSGQLNLWYRQLFVSPFQYSGGSILPTNNNYTLLDTAGQ